MFKWAPALGHSITAGEVETVNSLLLPGLGMFVFYVIHDALQEQMFRFEGFEYGWFMSMVEVFMMLILAVITEGADLKYPPGGFKTWGANALIGLCVAGSHGFGNTALRYSTYPLKVSFRSCKLVPTMALGVCVTGRRHSACEYIAALIMCAGLMTVTLADVTTHVTMDAEGHAETTACIGPLLLGISALLDSIVPNLQESIFTQTNARAVDTMFLSNQFMFVILTAITLISGELFTAWTYCLEHTQVFGILALQSTSAYFGLRCYLTIIKSHGSVGGVLLANARKVVTILVSFLLFAKPCKPMHLAGIALIFVGVYLGVVAKRARKHQGGWGKIPASPLPQASTSKSSIEPSPASSSSVLSALHNMSTHRDHVV
jgi:solute carrier family 35 (adenosine 3'-phospho 5'-phosphosulfate transporter), member B3